jgi:cytochrome o ubiquinol oxidase subunit IV
MKIKTKDITSFGGSGAGTYITGFGLSIILTVVPFFLVMTAAIAGSAALITIILFAAAQIIVHLICFLHMQPSSGQSWNWSAFIYTLILLCILVTASIWIMYHLNQNMLMD